MSAAARTRPLLAAALLVLIALAAYFPALQAGYIWDDNEYLTENPHLDSVAGLKRIWLDDRATPQYYPLVFTSFWVEKRLWGLDPRGYHLVNVLLHGASAALVWLLLRSLSLPLAWLAAAVFALHPVHVESVAWVTERKNVLSALGYLASLLAWLRFSHPDPERAPSRRRWAWYALSLALFLAALLAKSVTSSLPAVILLLFWWKRGRLERRDLPALLPFFALGIALGLHTAYLERTRVGTHGPEWALGALQRVLIAGRALWFYLGKLAWPQGLAFNYPRWQVDPALWWQHLFPLGAVAAALLLWLLRGRIGRGPLTAALFFAGTLFPALGFFNVFPMRYSFVADHFQYLASLGPIALAAGFAGSLLARRPRVPRLPLQAAAALLLLLLGALTWRQSRAYESGETLWRDTIAKHPGSGLANNNLGSLVFQKGDLAEAERLFRRAVEGKPDFSQAHYNLGMVLGRRGDLAGAIREFEEALRHYPYFPDAFAGIGVAHGMRGDHARAAAAFERAVGLRPDDVAAFANLARARMALGDLAGAREAYRAILRVKPGDAATTEAIRELTGRIAAKTGEGARSGGRE